MTASLCGVKKKKQKRENVRSTTTENILFIINVSVYLQDVIIVYTGDSKMFVHHRDMIQVARIVNQSFQQT